MTDTIPSPDMGDTVQWEAKGQTHTGRVLRPGVFGGGLSYKNIGIYSVQERIVKSEGSDDIIIWELPASDLAIIETWTPSSNESLPDYGRHYLTMLSYPRDHDHHVQLSDMTIRADNGDVVVCKSCQYVVDFLTEWTKP